MQPAIRKLSLAAVGVLAAGVLAGCGTLSHGVAPDGSHAQQLVWPQTSATNALHRGGSSPVLAHVQQIQPGLSKQQVMELIGAPHFGEGFGTREWDYLFNLRSNGAVTQCEFKILFDDHKVARSTYWNPASCADIVNPPPPKPEPTKPTDQTFTLSADALFAFDKYKLADVSKAGVADLTDVATKLTAAGVKADKIEVTGYTDRIGSDTYNLKLSTERANTVRDFLVKHGVAADHITATGRGEADPVVTCNDKGQAKLVACLAPNRRVVVKVEGTH
jgi:outer membrane protein OmpA-like peptidoglycan-associated protein